MDYEKKYNEAFAWIRDIYPTLTGAAKEDAEHYFPELRESEDERIRRELIEYLRGDLDDITTDDTDRWITWIEKQKEQKPERINVTEMVAKYRATDEYVEGEYKGKPVNCMIRAYEQGIRDTLSKVKEQKPAEWSEVELEFRGEKVTVKRPFYRDDKGRGYSTAELDEEVAWNALRAWCEKKGISLYDLYPKVEWSEEDEDMINCCISSIEEAKENRYAYKETDGDTSYDREIAFLKSLRPSWKPSKEQMEELMGGLRILPAGETYHILISLYNDLKKL